jgi:hypothetical protein
MKGKYEIQGLKKGGFQRMRTMLHEPSPQLHPHTGPPLRRL